MIEVFEDKKGEGLALMQDVLRDGGTLAPEYPLVFEERFTGAVLGVGEEGRVHSACGRLVRELVLPGERGELRPRIGLIGSVSTRPEERGRGLGTRVVLEAEARLQLEGCVAAFLWADDPNFYFDRGYAPVGTELDCVMPATRAPALPAPDGVRSLAPGDEAAVHALYARHEARVERNAGETAALLTCPRMDALVRERDGEVVAYALRGRGKDFADVIHEWGGSCADVLALVRAHLERRFESGAPGCIGLIAPASEPEVVEALEELGAQRTTGILALGKLLDRRAAAALLATHLPAGATIVPTDLPRPGLQLTGPSDTVFLDDENALALLFGSHWIEGAVRALLERVGVGHAALPLQPFLWGLDSI